MLCTLSICIRLCVSRALFFFFQAEDGIRDVAVTGVQTCALPIYSKATLYSITGLTVTQGTASSIGDTIFNQIDEIGRASCRGKSVDLGGRRIIKKKKIKGQNVDE